ncbi:hypothetical protein K7X08_016273 [Anisodus acutangulus]|uniref:Leucine-rich repeat-containing N-terminal plant-type domain-containing protein n=1 Tax=Anisodus acutangulus TaxID=402998 RepID=A0A9Q1R0P2_9SOLA|nr:hypothetical protein K7X08_016273 [Anisodus acutangulus]
MAKTCLLLVSLGLLSFFRAAFCCPNDQKQALLKFKSAFLENTAVNSSSSDGFFSYGLEDWNSTSDCCSWDRVICDSRPNSRAVIALYLDSLQSPEPVVVSSSVLAPLFGIKSLMMLILSSNHIQGQIAGEGIANLGNLVHLDLMQNNFTGSIPPQVSHLRHLQYLDFSGNLLTGVLKPEVGYLQKLRILKLDDNFIGIASVGFKGKSVFTAYSDNDWPLVNLSTLALSKNKLTSVIPSSIQNMTKLETLKLDNNMLTGEIPSWLFNMKALKNLFLGKNGLKWNNNAKIVPRCMLSGLSLQSCGLLGPIPEWISSQRSLDYLDLSNNKLEGIFPQWLAEMELGTVILSDNNLTGSLPPSLFHSRSLSLLDLSRNRFSGELPENMGNATAIMILILAENSFSGKIPSSITNIYRLLLLDLSKNRLSGTIPVFDPTSFLAYVDLSLNDFSGEVPLTFSQETRILALRGNNFTGSLARNLTNFYMLEHLDLHDNRITGELPNFISELSTLRSLNLRNNSLQGPVPSSISNLSNLQILDLSHNNFTGSIPAEVGNLVGMIETPSTFSSISFIFTFSIEYTDLIVNWKRSVQGKLRGLKMLNISYNGLKGKIPVTLGNLESLESIDLSHNTFSGPIPQSFTKLQQLTTLDVSNNHLKGKIPVGGQMDTMDDPTYYANNSGLCGFQIQLNCPDNKPPQAVEPVNESSESWFVWEAMWIGFPFGFIVSASVIFLTGFCTSRCLNSSIASS